MTIALGYTAFPISLQAEGSINGSGLRPGPRARCRVIVRLHSVARVFLLFFAAWKN